MAFWALPAAMAVGGLLKNELVDKPEHARQQKAQADMAAAQTQYSPLTGMGKGQFTPQGEPSSMDAAMKWGMAGAQMGQGMDFGGGEQAVPQDANMSAMNYKKPSNSPWVKSKSMYA